MHAMLLLARALHANAADAVCMRELEFRARYRGCRGDSMRHFDFFSHSIESRTKSASQTYGKLQIMTKPTATSCGTNVPDMQCFETTDPLQRSQKRNAAVEAVARHTSHEDMSGSPKKRHVQFQELVLPPIFEETSRVCVCMYICIHVFYHLVMHVYIRTRIPRFTYIIARSQVGMHACMHACIFCVCIYVCSQAAEHLARLLEPSSFQQFSRIVDSCFAGTGLLPAVGAAATVSQLRRI